MENDITNYIEDLFATALCECGNLHDAEDLTQETVLAALAFEARGGVIGNPRAWLLSTLHHKVNDSLRRKYRLPTVSIDEIPDLAEEALPEGTIPDEAVRREVAYLAKLQREVIVKHYLQGKKVQTIAEELGVPKGTVLSRLAAGREQMRKGFDKMESYEKHSYNPERLDVGWNGRQGSRGEPGQLVANDLMKQNILLVAYDRPVTAAEIARALGIPMPYIEAAVGELVRSGLMRETGHKVFTDFMIVSPGDLLKGLEVEIAFTEAHYRELLSLVQSFLGRLREVGPFGELPQNKAEKLQYFFLLELFSKALYTATQRIVPAKEEYPARPDGGAWIATGTRFPPDFDFESYEFGRYCYGGMRRAYWENAFGARSVELRIYDTQPDLNRYRHAPVEMNDAALAELLYLLLRGIPFEAAGFDLLYLENVPHLTECGILAADRNRGGADNPGSQADNPGSQADNPDPRTDNPGLRPDIPILRPEEYHLLQGICLQQMGILADFLEPKLRELLPRLKIEIPEHLKGRVAEFRQYSCYAIPMAFVKCAMREGDLEFLRSTPPMVLVVDDDNGPVDH